MAVVAARQCSLSASQRSADARRRSPRLATVGGSLLAFVFAVAFGVTLNVTTMAPAYAQGFTYNPRPPKAAPPRAANDGQMLVQAVEVDYDYNNSRVSAVGNVQMFYNGTSVEADKVIYDQKTKRLHATP